MHASEVFCIRRGIVLDIPKGIVNDDAYLAVATKSRGYRIKYVPDSEVGVYCPQTLGDYLRQRRRIIAGHYQIHEKTGHFSQFLFYSALVRPIVTFRLLVGYFALRGKIRSGIGTALIEVAANGLAALDRLRRKSYAVWSISTTTKMTNEL